jgi:hypothetical protein
MAIAATAAARWCFALDRPIADLLEVDVLR